jgi:hypothetical protein
MNRWQYLLYPELRRFPPERQAEALRTASETRFDFIEYVGMAAALILTVVLTRYSAIDMGLAERFGAAVVNFGVAMALLVVLAGPFYVRRTRRGLRAQLK